MAKSQPPRQEHRMVEYESKDAYDRARSDRESDAISAVEDAYLRADFGTMHRPARNPILFGIKNQSRTNRHAGRRRYALLDYHGSRTPPRRRPLGSGPRNCSIH